MVMVDIEVVDRKLDYNMLLSYNWTYAMTAIMSTIFHIILFQLDGSIFTMDQLSFCTPDYSPLPSDIVPLVGGIPDSYVSICTGLLKGSSLMGCFHLPPPTFHRWFIWSPLFLMTQPIPGSS